MTTANTLGPRGALAGIAAVGVKELRGRMRGKRAFVILTIYLLLLGGFAWMIDILMERSFTSGFGNSNAYASANIGQTIFAALMLLETLQVVFLAPSATAGAISLEREKQTLDMLIATPIPSLALVLGKLLSALVYVFLLIIASIPLTAIVFVFGGVAPDDVIRGYVVLLVMALGLGSFGLFCSSLVKRTQAATAIAIFGVLAITIGSAFVLIFWTGVANSRNGEGLGPIKGPAPEVVAYVNPFLAQADVMCGSQGSSGGWCSLLSSALPGRFGVVFQNTGGGSIPPVAVPIPAPAVDDKGNIIGGSGTVGSGPVGPDVVSVPTAGGGVGVSAPDVAPFGTVRDQVWPRSVVTWIVLSTAFILASVQLVSPTRRWRSRQPLRRPVEPDA